MSEWKPIETAPRDGTWFMICNAEDDFDSYEIGCYDPYYCWSYVEVGDGLYRHVREDEPAYEWRGFNNMHRATHWMPLPEPPNSSGERNTETQKDKQ